jgi:hypothetical protein
MPKRVYVRGHYRTYGKRSSGVGCIGIPALIAILVIFYALYLMASHPVATVLILLLAALGVGAFFFYRISRRHHLRQFSVQPQQSYTPERQQFYTNIQQAPASVAQLLLMTPQQFEECAASVMRAAGLINVQVTGKSGDHGIDIVAQSGNDKIVGQCKRYHPGKKVGNADLRNFIGAMSYARAQKGWFITTSTFSEEAKRYASAYPGVLILLDGNDFARCLQHYQPHLIIQQH